MAPAAIAMSIPNTLDRPLAGSVADSGGDRGTFFAHRSCKYLNESRGSASRRWWQTHEEWGER